jgi:hypothetical protein
MLLLKLTTGRRVLHVLQVMYNAHMQQLLPKITCPALLVVGERDFR